MGSNSIGVREGDLTAGALSSADAERDPTSPQPRSARPEAEAIDALYARHGRQVYNFCSYRLGNREEAEDATQLTFLNAFRGLRRGTAVEIEAAWLFKIAENVCFNSRRSSTRRRRVEAPVDLLEIQHLLAGPDPEREALIGLKEALACLPERQRLAFLLREWRGLSYKEISAALELSPSAVETLIFRARRTLVQQLQDPPSNGHRRLRALTDLSSIAGALHGFLFAGGVKTATTLATVAAATAVAGSPELRAHVVGAAAPARALVGASRTAAPARTEPVTAPTSDGQEHPPAGVEGLPPARALPAPDTSSGARSDVDPPRPADEAASAPPSSGGPVARAPGEAAAAPTTSAPEPAAATEAAETPAPSPAPADSPRAADTAPSETPPEPERHDRATSSAAVADPGASTTTPPATPTPREDGRRGTDRRPEHPNEAAGTDVPQEPGSRTEKGETPPGKAAVPPGSPGVAPTPPRDEEKPGVTKDDESGASPSPGQAAPPGQSVGAGEPGGEAERGPEDAVENDGGRGRQPEGLPAAAR